MSSACRERPKRCVWHIERGEQQANCCHYCYLKASTCSRSPVDPSVVCRVLSVCAVSERCGGVQSDPETTGCRSGPPCCRRDGHQHRPRDRIQHPAGDVQLQRHYSQVCVKLAHMQPKSAENHTEMLTIT